MSIWTLLVYWITPFPPMRGQTSKMLSSMLAAMVWIAREGSGSRWLAARPDCLILMQQCSLNIKMLVG